MATKKAAGRTTSKKRGAAKRRSARAKSSRGKTAGRKSGAAQASARRTSGARTRATKQGKRTGRATKAVRRRARQGVEVAKEGLDKMKEFGEKTWGTVKSATVGVVHSVKQKLAREPAEAEEALSENEL
jgi:hypothetical protein